MKCAVRQIAVHRSGNVHRRKIEIVSAAGSEGELLIDPLFNRQRNVCEITRIVGFIIAVILFAENFQGVVARCKVGRNFHTCRTEFSVLCDAAVVKNVATFSHEHGGNIFVLARACTGVSDGQTFARF